MKKLFLTFCVISFLSIPCFATSSLTDPHFGRLVTCGQRHLIQKRVIIFLIDHTTIIGTVIDYTSSDCMVHNKTSNKMQVIPLSSVLSISIITEE